MTICLNRLGLGFRVVQHLARSEQQLARSGQTAGDTSFMSSAEDVGYSLACILLYRERHEES